MGGAIFGRDISAPKKCIYNFTTILPNIHHFSANFQLIISFRMTIFGQKCSKSWPKNSHKMTKVLIFFSVLHGSHTRRLSAFPGGGAFHLLVDRLYLEGDCILGGLFICIFLFIWWAEGIKTTALWTPPTVPIPIPTIRVKTNHFPDGKMEIGCFGSSTATRMWGLPWDEFRNADPLRSPT